MKNFIITSKVQSIKILQYNVEADSLEEAIEIASRGNSPHEEIDETVNYDDEYDFRGYEDKDDEDEDDEDEDNEGEDGEDKDNEGEDDEDEDNEGDE